MHVRHLTVADFRSYESADLALSPGVSTLLGRNGQGKTNLVEAIGYLATLGSHRVATDAPLVRFGAPRAVVRGAVVRGAAAWGTAAVGAAVPTEAEDVAPRETLLEVEITPGRANRAKVNRNAVSRPRDLLGHLRTVFFAPEDLALVKGDPGERRRFLDDLLVARQPRWAGVRSDYDRILKQRGALLKSAAPLLRKGPRRRSGAGGRPVQPSDAADLELALHTLEVWDAHLARVGSQLLYARLRLLRDLRPLLTTAYDEVSDARSDAVATYKSSLRDETAGALAAGEVPEIEALHDEILTTMSGVRDQEVERGVNLVGPHRDDLTLSLGAMPAKGYASHGESWSFALGLKLAAYHLLRHDLGDDPVLVLDDVFAELDAGRRGRLAAMIADCEQVLVTAAVPADVPEELRGARYAVTLGEVRRDD